MPYKKIFNLCILALTFTSCSKEDMICENTVLQLCNPKSDQIVLYNVTGGTDFDTLFPGECKTSTHGELIIKYENDGSVKSINQGFFNYKTPTEDSQLQFTSCFWKLYAPSGYTEIDHCLNRVFNPDKGELDTDCGGNCKPCVAVTLPCESNFNRELKWSNLASNLTQANTLFGDMIDNKEIITFRFNQGGEFMLALPTFHSSLPSKSERLLIGKDYFNAEAWFVDDIGTNFREAKEGESIYFEVNDLGQKFIKFCDVEFRNDNGSVVNGSAKLDVVN